MESEAQAMTENLLPALPDADKHLTPIYSKEEIEKRYRKRPNGTLRSSEHNIFLLLRHHERYHGIFRYSYMLNGYMVCKPAPWDDPKNFQPRKLGKNDLTYLKSDLALFDLYCCRQSLRDCLWAVCEENHLGDKVESAHDDETVTRLAESFLRLNPYSTTRDILTCLDMQDEPGRALNRNHVAKLLKNAGWLNDTVFDYNKGFIRKWVQTTKALTTIEGQFTEVT